MDVLALHLQVKQLFLRVRRQGKLIAAEDGEGLRTGKLATG
jgi:hypothetical protein